MYIEILDVFIFILWFSLPLNIPESDYVVIAEGNAYSLVLCSIEVENL